MNERNTLKINSQGRLEIGGAEASQLAREFGTPLYVYDEDHIRNMIRAYKRTLLMEYNGNGMVFYASKAFACLAMYRIAQSEGIGVDVVSGGELYTALKAGVDPRNICMHGNNKLLSELAFAVDNNVGFIVIDSAEEADAIDSLAARKGIVQRVLIRINPGVEAHTHEYVQTARPDSKFGFGVADGSALRAVGNVLAKKHLHLSGLHCHIGSQIFEQSAFTAAAEKVMGFVRTVKDKCGYEIECVNFGGGFGVWYADGDLKLSPDDYGRYFGAIIKTVKAKAGAYGLKLPQIFIEPGRSIVGEAGITLYTVGAIKDIPGVRKYVSVDGGMFENPRYALYKSKYTALPADRAAEACTQTVTIAGKCCESGDLLIEDANLPKVHTGDILAVLTTGAYNYSMASNYNRNLIPAAVLVKDGKADCIIKRQTYDDLIKNDVIPQRLK